MTTYHRHIINNNNKTIIIIKNSDEIEQKRRDRELKKEQANIIYNLHDFRYLNIFEDYDKNLIYRLQWANKHYLENKEDHLKKVKTRQQQLLINCNVCDKLVYPSHFKSKKHFKNLKNIEFN